MLELAAAKNLRLGCAPNIFGGTVQLFTTAQPAWQELSITHGYTSNSRGVGVLDMATALRTDAVHRIRVNLKMVDRFCQANFE